MDLKARFNWLLDNRSLLTRHQQRRQREFITRYRFPLGLQMKFAREFPNLTDTEREQVFTALRQYFLACHTARRRMVAMPSQITDEAWHAFILFTRDYKDFCQQAFGYFLHHTPVEAMASATLASDGLKRVWRLCCQQESIDPLKPHRLPLLFAIDADLKIANGQIYHLDSPPGAARLTDSQSYDARHIGCSGCGSGRFHGESDCGSSCGSDGGSSCGSSCGGGGCGGGGD